MAARPRRVLVGYDGSESAQRALEAAAALIGYGSTLAVASVASPGEPAKAALDEARERLLERHVPASYVLLHGEAADELLGAAEGMQADLIVVGGKTANGKLGAGLGRVSGDVVQRAPCDVLVVR
jgi:nucleotide-binding universal stress UspA family protein